MQTEKEYLVGREVRALRCESVGEYSLPDYNGDIRKVLALKTKVFPTGKFVGDDSLEISGTVGYEFVYLDAENNVTHAEFLTDYDAAVRINSETYVDSDVETSVSGCNMRLVGPRKISVKCMLDSDVHISERRCYTIGGDAFMEYEPQILSTSASVLATSFFVGESKAVSEELLSIDGAIADEVEVLLSDARVFLDTVEPAGDGVTLDGMLKVTVLYRNADERPKLLSKDIPYSAQLVPNGLEKTEYIDARVDTTSFTSSVSPTEDGVALSVFATLTPKISLKGNAQLPLVHDAYLKERGTENEYTELSYTEHVCTHKESVRFEEKRSLSEIGLEQADEVIYAEASVRTERCEFVGGVVKIDGEVRFAGIGCSDNDEVGAMCSPIKFALPFSENVKLNCQKDGDMRLNCTVTARNAEIEFGENSVLASCLLDVGIDVYEEKRERCLSGSYLTDEEFTRDESVVTVYYPDKTESLFGIAKRFHTSVESIARDNKLSESVFTSSGNSLGTAGVKRLIIK